MVEHSRKPAKKSRRKKDLKMAGDIWKQFPRDVMETILAKLPLPTISRFRSVSRDWNSSLTSNTFSRAQLQQQQRQPYPWIYTITREKNNPGIMYDHCSRKWYQNSVVLPNPNFVPKASAGGLVCFMDVSHPTSFYVCNPLTKSIKQLPPRSVPLCSQSGVGMILMNRNSNNYDHYDHCYKIVCLGSLGEFEVYDSITNSWILSHMPAATIDAPLDLDRWSQYVAIETTLYFIRKTPDAIVSFDAASGAWQQFVIPFPLHSTEHRIAEWRGKLLVVGLLREERTCDLAGWESLSLNQRGSFIMGMCIPKIS